MVDRFFTISAAQAHQPLHQQESSRLLKYLFDFCARKKKNSQDGVEGDAFADFEAYAFAIDRLTASVVNMLAYGIRIETGDEHSVQTAKLCNDHFLDSLNNVWPCDVLPLLNWLPSWLAPWKKIAQEWHEYQCLHHLEDMERGKMSSKWNLTKVMLASKEGQSMSELEIAFDAGVISDAGVDTTASTFMMILLATASNPTEVAKAQKKIDTIVGRDPLPTFEDRKSLPYVVAFITEVMRWHPVIPGGLPYSNLHSDTYNGYRIPAGAVIMPNFWTIHMDTATHGDPDVFRPERFLDDPKLPMVGFGFGRRGCIGQNVAKDELFIGTARLLWKFDFLAENEELEGVQFTEKSLIRPKPFELDMRLRDNNVGRTVNADVELLKDVQTRSS